MLPLALLACGTPGSTTTPTTEAAAIPACAKAGTPVATPSSFPSSFPLPPGTVVTSTQNSAGGVILNAVAPGEIDSTKEFLETQVPKAGFDLDGTESEDNEAESEFEGHGYKGRWRLHSISGCPNALTLTLFAQPE